MTEILRRGGTSEGENLTEEEEAALHNILKFSRRDRLEKPDFSDGPGTKIKFPKYCFDEMDKWRGNHPGPLNYEFLDESAKTARSCFDVVTDESYRDPKTVSFHT
jgi:hypothetical protein